MLRGSADVWPLRGPFFASTRPDRSGHAQGVTRLDEAELCWLERAGRPRIACRKRSGNSPTILFLPGYASDMEGAKALALDAFAAERGLAMVRFDYSGTGASEGSFEEGTLGGWLNDATEVVDRFTKGPLLVVGSSMGAWIALHFALRRPEQIRALVGISAAPDFTEWAPTDGQKATIEREGRLVQHKVQGAEPYITSRAFWRSGQDMRLLEGPIGVHCPVRLVHGERDREVPLAIVLRLMSMLRSADVQLNIIKGGGHRLSEPHEIATILRTVEALLEPVP